VPIHFSQPTRGVGGGVGLWDLQATRANSIQHGGGIGSVHQRGLKLVEFVAEEMRVGVKDGHGQTPHVIVVGEHSMPT
jgi:hypothetical protein